ncbi:MAG: cupin domain-containing protein [Pyrinomonadaceae bacterium]
MSEENARDTSDSIVLQPGEGRQIDIGPNRISYKIGSEQTGGAFSLIEYSVGPRFKAPPTPHFHTHESWAGYVIEGTLGFELGEQTVNAPAGTFLFVPKGLPFKWWNAEDRPAKYLAIYFPSGFEKYFEDLNELTRELPPGPVDLRPLMPKILPLWEKYGIGTASKKDEG